jgi:hypothetical protein
VAFADPQSVTYNAVAQTLPRVSTLENRSSYKKDDDSLKLDLSTSPSKSRVSRAARLYHQKTVSDPLIPANSMLTSMSVSIVINEPKLGYSVADRKLVVDALVAWASANSGANITKLLGGEN